MKIELQGYTALVTGGTRGIGEAIVREMAAAGATVIVCGTRPPKSKIAGTRYEAVDFSDARATELFAARLAGERIDILVNNAGINRIALAGDVKLEDWDEIQSVNVRAPFLLCRALAPKMAERGFGRIVNITSIFAQLSKSMRLSYSTSKSALAGLTRALALDYAKQNVLANCVAPGFIDTELTRSILTAEQTQELIDQVPLGRLGTPEEIAKVVLFLASRSNSFITGQNIIADGGFSNV